MTIAIIDQNLDFLYLLRAFFKKQVPQASVSIFNSSSEFSKSLNSENHLDLVIFDPQNLADSSLQLVDQVQSLFPESAFILFSNQRLPVLLNQKFQHYDKAQIGELVKEVQRLSENQRSSGRSAELPSLV